MTFDPTGRTTAVPAQDAPISTPVWSAPVQRHRTSTVIWASLGIVVGALAVLLVLVYMATFLGAAAVGICLVLALIPLTLVILAVRWVDRWEPEPHPALWFAFLWGAGVSVVSALVFDLGVQIYAAASGTGPGGDFLSAVVQAPLVEEAAKGFGLLLLFWVIRAQFNGPIDGLVYAAVIAAGFAFSENIQYFGVAMLEGGLGTLGVTFLLRGVLSPFAHVLFTACTGFALGLAARRATGSGYIGTVLIGFVAAVLLHALWNGAFFVLTTDGSLLGYYLLVQVPMFLGAILTVVLLRRHEEKLTVQRLGDYAAVGWFTPAEVQMLATGHGRRQALAWAHAQPTSRRLAMQRFIVDAARLASVRHRLIAAQAKPVRAATAGVSPDQAEETRLLGLLMADRAEILN
ncbi:PrsW family intramembrane metalloprotease [Cryobacterium sp. 1639]|uniref:PrsW family intramembrane metalloprotease n=1 Tax=Cryobacterium inferilacus TaxID=2866629 RepID=UPI001C73A6E3|nr:PrsW family intramembrane metalloprotease [Cryobacterium sp. 1639]MBX0300021.1 PrsW family intramembrane metalloprotease [Cryobacterium sp. 1639]